jgi:hypothetical protein
MLIFNHNLGSDITCYFQVEVQLCLKVLPALPNTENQVQLGKGVGRMEGPAFAGSFANGEVAPAECVWV